MTTSMVEAGLAALTVPPGPDRSGEVIQASLATLRRHLDMEVGFVGRFDRGCRVFEFVDSGAPDLPVRVGGRDPVEQTFCGRVAHGLAPELMTDAGREPAVADLPVTRQLDIGAHLSVPLRRVGGELLGTICCFRRTPDPTLRDRDLGLLRLFADLVGQHLEALLTHEDRVGQVRREVDAVIDDGGPAIALQPIVSIETGALVGVEALSRFGDRVPGRTPQQWFEEAARAGVGPELEAAAVASALEVLPRIPAALSLSLNVSVEALAHPPVLEHLLAADTERLVVEVTEQTPVEDARALARPLGLIRRAGGRVAVDDAGAGYAGLQHIVQLEPEVVKVDRCLVTGVDDDPGRRAMITALVEFGRHMDVDLVAEGVETAAEAATLAELGVGLGQGFHFGRPAAEVSTPGR